MGPSGSGKTTLLNVISGFINADGGKVILDGQDILTGEENELAEIRQRAVITVKVLNPAEEDIKSNPLGIYITDFDIKDIN